MGRVESTLKLFIAESLTTGFNQLQKVHHPMRCIPKYSFSMLHARDICKHFDISLSILRTKPEIQTARFAQQICLEMALQKPRKVLPLISEGFPLNLHLDPGVLAAAVGPIPVMISLKSKPSKKRKGEGEESSEIKSQKRELLVLLGLRCPEDEVVMQKPVRATRDLFGDLTDQERTKAIQEARAQVHRLQSPMLPAMKTATFKGVKWEVDGRSWSEVLQEGVKATWEKWFQSKHFGNFWHL